MHESGTSGTGRCTRGARDFAVVHDIAEWCTSMSGARWCTRLWSGARWYTSRSSNGQAAGSSTTVEEACEWCTRAVHESGTSGAYGAREVHEITQWCTRLRSGARGYMSRSSDGQAAGSATTVEKACKWCMRVVRVEHDGAREVHEITQWCMRLRSGTRVRVVHDGAREVHKIA